MIVCVGFIELLIVIDRFQGFTTAQLQQVEEDTMMISQREKEIQHIVKSIFDLNEIFKDLSVMIIDQVCSSYSVLESSHCLQNFKMVRNIGNIAKRTHGLLKLFA